MRKTQLCAFAMLILISQTNFGRTKDVKISCLESEYTHNGFCCDKCHPGHKLEERCPGPGTRSKCVQCENGTFQESANFYPNCFTCHTCKPYSVEAKSCTTKTNTVCECVSGYYMEELGISDWRCTLCKKCGPGQLQVGECTSKQNTQCKCKEKYYDVGKNICEPCVKCQKDCEHLCTSSTPPNPLRSANPTSPSDLSDILPKILAPIFGCTTVVAVGVFMLYEGIRHWRKRKSAMSSKPSSPASENQTLFITVPPDTVNESVPFTHQSCEPEQHRKLPDCVPREIKMHEFFYFALDEIPVGRFKELVRRLGVSEQNIERAEHDHRTSKDAHYQMLKVWSDSCTGGGNNVLPCHRIQMFIETLRDMYLVNCADNIENRFLSRDTSTS